MASAEKEMRKIVVKMLQPLHGVSIESGVGIGVPDVNCVYGWIELKSVDLPVKPDTPVRVKHFTREQKIWLQLREAAGGLALLLLKAGPWWLIFDATTAAEVVGKVPLHKLVDRCIDGWNGTPDKEEFLACLQKIWDPESDSSSSDGEDEKP